MRRVLLDKHTLTWAQDQSDKLSVAAEAVLRDPAHALLLRTATLWELDVKMAIGELRLSLPYRTWIEKAFADLGLVELAITLASVERQIGLPFHHRDPFDRLLAAQALTDGLVLVSADVIFDANGVPRLWT